MIVAKRSPCLRTGSRETAYNIDSLNHAISYCKCHKSVEMINILNILYFFIIFTYNLQIKEQSGKVNLPKDL